MLSYICVFFIFVKQVKRSYNLCFCVFLFLSFSFVFCQTSRRVVDAMLSVICAGTSWRRTGSQAEIYFLQQAERAREFGWSADTKTKTMLYFLQPIVSTEYSLFRVTSSLFCYPVFLVLKYEIPILGQISKRVRIWKKRIEYV